MLQGAHNIFNALGNITVSSRAIRTDESSRYISVHDGWNTPRFKFFRAYLDEVVIFSQDIAENIQQLAATFSLVSFHRLKIKISKCELAKEEVEQLRNIFSAEGIAVNPEKI